MTLTDAVTALTTTYQDLELIARGLVVDAKEVSDAFSKATPDTAEYVALALLQKNNPYSPPRVYKKE